MREIKFRVWDKGNKIMFKIFDSTEDIDWFLPMWMKRYEIMQYADLKDKYGDEGYENDIILVYRRGDNEKEYPQKLKISYLNGCFMVGTCTNHEFYRLYQQDFEIIGNIFENPELLGRETA